MAKKKKNSNNRTSILFLLNDDVGALINSLKPFKANDVNLTRIESRPHKNKEWQYEFFIEIEGKRTDLNVIKALHALKRHTTKVYILGSYPLRRVK